MLDLFFFCAVCVGRSLCCTRYSEFQEKLYFSTRGLLFSSVHSLKLSAIAFHRVAPVPKNWQGVLAIADTTICSFSKQPSDNILS